MSKKRISGVISLCLIFLMYQIGCHVVLAKNIIESAILITNTIKPDVPVTGTLLSTHDITYTFIAPENKDYTIVLNANTENSIHCLVYTIKNGNEYYLDGGGNSENASYRKFQRNIGSSYYYNNWNMTFSATKDQTYNLKVCKNDSSVADVEYRLTIKSNSKQSKKMEYEYDVQGRLISISNDGVLVAKYEYDDNGNLLRVVSYSN